MKISITIPCYEYKGKGVECLQYSFEKMETQTFKDFDVIISDHSIDKGVEDLCKIWKSKLDIKYFRNDVSRGNPAGNMNEAMRKAEGEWIKILCQDDFLAYNNSLEITANAFDEKTNWIATGYIHTTNRKSYQNYHQPYINPQIYVINTIGTPSCITIRNIKPTIEMDENLSYAYDCEFYYRFANQYGVPKIVSDVTIANFLWENSITAGTTEEIIDRENKYILKKHGFLNENKPS